MAFRPLSFLAVLTSLAIAADITSAADDTALHLANVGASNTAYVQVPNHADFALQQFTLEAWLQRTGNGYGFSTDPSGASIISKPIQNATGSDIASWHLHWTPTGQIHFNLTHTPTSSGVYLLSSAVATPLARHHVAVTFDGTTIKTYIDGAPTGQAAWNLGTVYYGNNDVLLGCDNFAAGYLRRFDGWIDDVRVWDRARTQAEIAANKDCRLEGTETNLVAYWTFDDSNLLDRTIHHHDGAAVQVGGALTYGSLASIPLCTTDAPVGGASSGLALAVYPQPARDRFTTRFDLPVAGPVTLEAVDVAGRRLALLAEQEYPAGRHEITFDRSSLGRGSRNAGVVFLRLLHAGTSITQVLALVR